MDPSLGLNDPPIWVTDMFAYRAFHLRHHRHLNTPDDPEMELRKRGAPSWDVPRHPAYFVFRFLFDLLGGCAASNLRLIGYAFPKSHGTFLGMSATWGVAITALALTDNLWVLALWLITFATSLGTFLRFRIWLEHILVDANVAVTFLSPSSKV
jgi:fatty acid desaturase